MIEFELFESEVVLFLTEKVLQCNLFHEHVSLQEILYSLILIEYI